MSFTAKFMCERVVDTGSFYLNIYMSPVECPENTSWAKYSPSGSITMSVSKDTDVAKKLTPGSLFTICFTEEKSNDTC